MARNTAIKTRLPDDIRRDDRRKAGFTLFKGALVVVAVVCGLVMFLSSSVFAVSEINLVGAERVTREQLSAAGLTVGENFFRIPYKAAKKALLGDPFVKDVSVEAVPPDRVTVTVTERVPRAYIDYKGDGYLLVDIDGYVLARLAGLEDGSLPLVKGVGADGFTVGERLSAAQPAAFEAVVELTRILEKYEVYSGVSSMDMSNTLDISIMYGKWRVLLGGMDGADEKVRFFASALTQGDIPDFPGEFNIKEAGRTGYLFTLKR